MARRFASWCAFYEYDESGSSAPMGPGRHRRGAAPPGFMRLSKVFAERFKRRPISPTKWPAACPICNSLPATGCRSNQRHVRRHFKSAGFVDSSPA